MIRVECPKCQGYGDIVTFRGHILCPLCEGAETVTEEAADGYRQEQAEIKADMRRINMQDREDKHP